ncbi:MAG: NAD(P)-dependent oxidoreductase, partial [Archaeoglobaceae archaeon]
MRLPLYIEFSGKKIAIIGGGDIGSFRAKKFADAGAEVTVYSLEFSSDLIQLEKLGKVRLISANARDLDYEKILPNYDLVVVALADKSLNSRI